MEKRYWIVKNSINASCFADKGIAAVGWSEVNFAEELRKGGNDVERVVSVAASKYNYISGYLAGRKKGEIRRFLQIGKGDIVIVPCYKGFYLGEASGERIYDEESSKIDRANWLCVRFIKGEGNKPLCFPRDNKNTALSTKIGCRHMILEIWEKEITVRVQELYEKGEDVSEYRCIQNAENDSFDELKSLIRTSIGNYSRTSLEAKGYGFERLIVSLFQAAGYTSYILSKKCGNGNADADVVAIKEGILGPEFDEVYYIQAKHHEGITSDWGKKQIRWFKEQMQKNNEDPSAWKLYNEKDTMITGVDPARFKYILITSGEFDGKAEDEDVILIDGNKLSEMIAQSIDKIDDEMRHRLGILKKYQYYNRFSE